MRILFVDDDPDIRALAVRAVSQEFPEAAVAEATDRRMLVDQLAVGPVNILVTDYDLRWMDGLAVYRLTKEANPDCIAVMFTGTGNEELAVRAIKAGFDDYIVKATGQLRRLATAVRLACEREAERRLLQDNRELLREELYHRLHNNLQIVISLMALTRRAIIDEKAKAQVRDLMRRIESLSLLQERFYRADDLRRIDVGAFLRTLAYEFESAAPAARIETDIEPLVVPVNVAVPLGLMANELIMMGAGHSGSGSPADVSVSLRVTDKRVLLGVERRGGDPFAEAADRGLGLDLVSRLAAQIGCTVDRESTSEIARVRVTLSR